ncbi:hypothetical protein GA0070604_4078 [Micromonospora eburnea]|uniref:Uncharacterized protein n=1 Tax=Micromonospora eburnea TaxID=227316 RepID=A0A1C6V008_9ACTN|nr:hypothetical protein GA0070604_4078 [Micromonospora eburnea]
MTVARSDGISQARASGRAADRSIAAWHDRPLGAEIAVSGTEALQTQLAATARG